MSQTAGSNRYCGPIRPPRLELSSLTGILTGRREATSPRIRISLPRTAETKSNYRTYIYQERQVWQLLFFSFLSYFFSFYAVVGRLFSCKSWRPTSGGQCRTTVTSTNQEQQVANLLYLSTIRCSRSYGARLLQCQTTIFYNKQKWQATSNTLTGAFPGHHGDGGEGRSEKQLGSSSVRLGTRRVRDTSPGCHIEREPCNNGGTFPFPFSWTLLWEGPWSMLG